MRCPICGAKMIQNQLCQYCNITDEQVIHASNKKVKEYRKKDMKDLLYFTNVVPKDVSRMKLLLYTIFFGLIGVNHYYVHRVVRGTYSVLSTVLCITFFLISIIFPIILSQIFFRILYELSFYLMIFNIIMWISDIINVSIKAFKIPVVLADKESLKK